MSKSRSSQLACLLALLVAVTLGAQESTDPAATDAAEAVASPSGSASLIFEDRPVANVGFSLRADGERFALTPIAEVLGIALRIGPLGESHTLIFEDGDEILVGPDEAAYVVRSADGVERHRLGRAPIETVHGLEVPLEFLERTFGDQLDFDFTWSFRQLELTLARRELRDVSGDITLVHQFGASVLELRLSQRPRFRFEPTADGAELRLLGARLTLDKPFSRPADPLVRDLEVGPSSIRLRLAEGAVAEAPRLVPTGSSFSLVVDIRRGNRSARSETRNPSPIPDPRPAGLRTIVLDPGHGGEETGAVGANGSLESVLNLRVAELLERRLEQRLPVEVELTRRTDEDLPLESRVAYANEAKADLFISLHFNSYPGTRAHGAETYFLSREASDQLAAASAERENGSTGDERGELADLELILWDLAQSYHLGESQRFANLVQEELNQALGLRNRGVRQAPFKVLMGTTMPAVLVELGFLSNPEDEKKLQSPAYLAQLADSLVRAITRFKTQLEARQRRLASGSSADTPEPTGGRP
ncbi:MAG: N-acetylmuramoyl-L-alanine amidase [Acidobacteriota bacterium]